MHFVRMYGPCHANKAQRQALINSIFTQDTTEAVDVNEWRAVTYQLRPKFRRLADMMETTDHDVLAHRGLSECASV